MRRDLVNSQQPFHLFKNFFQSHWPEYFFENSLIDNFGNCMRTDIREEEGSFILEVEIPGHDKNDISLECRDNRLTIFCHHENSSEKDEHYYLKRERHRGSISRTYRLDNIKEEKISAEYKNGILRIVLPKDDNSRELSHKIPIQ
ncbi:MAG: Hsp20/alpha crystallin family protein [Syntrophomonadaceae bacterium]|nr:Hsp20/alpha crystallin family protein [Syntrophomonadaceae bacterium]